MSTIPGNLHLTRRRLLAHALLGTASTVLAACGAPATPVQPTASPTRRPASVATATAPAATATPVTLAWATPGNPAEVAVYQKLARTVEGRQPRLTITTSVEASEFATLRTLLASGTAPDLLFCTINNWASLAGNGVFRPLDDVITASRFDLDDFYPQIIRPYRYDPATRAFGQGQLHGLPKEIAVRIFYYNLNKFRTAGLPPPAADKPLTWEQFLDAVKKTTRREGDRVTEFGYVSEVWWGMWALWAWANGGEVVDDVFMPTRATMDDPKVVEGLKFWADLVTRHQVSAPLEVFREPGQTQGQGKGRDQFFADGKAAVYNNGRWMVPLFRQVRFTWDVMPAPQGSQRAQLLTGSIFGINQATKMPDAAWQLLSYITGQEGQLLLTELGVLQPSRRSVAESDIFLKVRPPTANRVFLDELAHARLLPLHPRYPDMEAAVNEEVERVLTGAKTPAEAGAAMTERVNAVLRG